MPPTITQTGMEEESIPFCVLCVYSVFSVLLVLSLAIYWATCGVCKHRITSIWGLKIIGYDFCLYVLGLPVNGIPKYNTMYSWSWTSSKKTKKKILTFLNVDLEQAFFFNYFIFYLLSNLWGVYPHKTCDRHLDLLYHVHDQMDFTDHGLKIIPALNYAFWSNVKI